MAQFSTPAFYGNNLYPSVVGSGYVPPAVTGFSNAIAGYPGNLYPNVSDFNYTRAPASSLLAGQSTVPSASLVDVNSLRNVDTSGYVNAVSAQNPKLVADAMNGGVNNTSMASMFDWTKLGLGAAVSLANLYNGWQANELAKNQFEYSKGLADTNLYNSATNYNNALESQTRTAGIMNGTSDADIAARIAKYSAKSKI